jgi:hypothetical protein
MKTMNLFLAALVTLGVSLTVLRAGAVARAAEPASKNGKLFHVVTLKFKPSATKEQIKAVENAFVGLKEKIPGITSLDWGTNVSPEKHDKGFTHCFVLSFASEKDRDAYLPHPAHKAFGKVLGPIMGDVMVIDFWSRGNE